RIGAHAGGADVVQAVAGLLPQQVAHTIWAVREVLEVSESSGAQVRIEKLMAPQAGLNVCVHVPEVDVEYRHPVRTSMHHEAAVRIRQLLSVIVDGIPTRLVVQDESWLAHRRHVPSMDDRDGIGDHLQWVPQDVSQVPGHSVRAWADVTQAHALSHQA